MSMKKYCDFLFTTKKEKDGYVWKILNDKREVLQSSLDNEDPEDRYFENKIQAELDCREAIQEYYR